MQCIGCMYRVQCRAYSGVYRAHVQGAVYRLTVQFIGCMYRAQCTGLQCRVQGTGFRVQCIGLRCRLQGSGCCV